jgi:hypothetical protein
MNKYLHASLARLKSVTLQRPLCGLYTHILLVTAYFVHVVTFDKHITVFSGYNRPILSLIIIPLFITQVPTCFDTYVSSSGSVLYPCELLKVRNFCVIGTYPCTVNVGVHRMLWFGVLLCPAEGS